MTTRSRAPGGQYFERQRGRKPAPLRPLTAEQQQLVERHLPFVAETLKRFCYRHRVRDSEGLAYADLYQEGVLGLMDAASRPGPTDDEGFRRRAYHRVLGAIRHGLDQQGFLIRRPRNSTGRRSRRPECRRPSQDRLEVPGIDQPVDFWARTERRPRLGRHEATPAELVAALLSRLRRRSRRVVELCRLEGLPLHRAGRILGLSVPSVSAIRARAERLLRRVGWPREV